jgi:hypothetical protein
MSDREELHALVDHVRDSDVASAKDFLRSLIDPFELALLTAPPDDEPLSDTEHAALRDADRRRSHGERPATHQELLAELGVNESSLR